MTALLFLPHLDVAGGLGVHARMLLAALQTNDSPLRYEVVTIADPGKCFPNTAAERFDRASVDDRFRFHTVPLADAGLLADPLDPLLKPSLEELKSDLVYSSYYTGLASCPVPQVVTFHDAGFLDNPVGFGPTAARRRVAFETIRGRIHTLHCISGDARDRICRGLGWPSERTRVVWHALPDDAATLEAAKNTASPFTGRYLFLPVGAATGFNRVRKNVPRAVDAFRALNDSSVNLIIAGTATLTESTLQELLPSRELGHRDGDRWVANDGRIVVVPTLDRVPFLAAMARAAAVVYSSRYEGFGLPVLEAMALGVPLIAAHATSIPEIVADAAVLVDPDDTAGFTNAMQAVLSDPDLCQELIHRGSERAKHFTLSRLGLEMTAMILNIAVT